MFASLLMKGFFLLWFRYSLAGLEIYLLKMGRDIRDCCEFDSWNIGPTVLVVLWHDKDSTSSNKIDGAVIMAMMMMTMMKMMMMRNL